MTDNFTLETPTGKATEFVVGYRLKELEYRFGCRFRGPRLSKATFIRNAQAKGYVPLSVSAASKRFNLELDLSRVESDVSCEISFVIFMEERAGDLIILPQSRISFNPTELPIKDRRHISMNSDDNIASGVSDSNATEELISLSMADIMEGVFEQMPCELYDLAEATEVEWGDLKLTKGGACVDIPVSLFSDDDTIVPDAREICRMLQRSTLAGSKSWICHNYQINSTNNVTPAIQWYSANGEYLTKIHPQSLDTIRLEVSAPNRAVVRKLIEVRSGKFTKQAAMKLSWNLMVALKPIFDAAIEHAVGVCRGRASANAFVLGNGASAPDYLGSTDGKVC